MTTIALKETAEGWLPCHLSDIKKDDVFYVVVDGTVGEISIALSDPVLDPSSESGWVLSSRRVD